MNELEEKMREHFEKRTKEHINRVFRNALHLVKTYPELSSTLLMQATEHDDSKFLEPEFTPYLHISWKYKVEGEGGKYEPSADIMEGMHEATVHHIRNNKHHPEYWDEGFDGKKFERDAPVQEIVDGTKMDRTSVAEMCCDWTSMSQELEGSNSAHSWAEKVINKRFAFTDEQIVWINDFLDVLMEQ